MKTKTSVVNIVVLVGLNLVAANSYAADQGLEACIQAVKKEKAGDLIKLEKLNVAGKGVYELEVAGANQAEWEFLCDADNGKITERETEVASADDQTFKKNVKISEEEAIAIAVKAHPGTVQEVEYEVEENGASSYEIDIADDKGIETKVEVDAASGEIIETATEEWEIGEESDEKR